MEIENKLKAYFEQQIKNIEADVNVEEEVMSRITAPKRRFVRKKILIFATVLSMLLISTGLVFGEEIIKTFFKEKTFYNDKGEVEWFIRGAQEDPNEELKRKILDSVPREEGKAYAIYIDNPINDIFYTTEPVTIQDIDIINTYAGQLLDVPFKKELLKKYKFKSGRVTFNSSERIEPIPIITADGSLTYELLVEMQAEAKETNSEYIVKEMEISTDVRLVSSHYFKDSNKSENADFIVAIVEWGGNNTSSFIDEEVDYGFDVIKLGDSETLYEDHNGFKQITWISEGIYYHVASCNPQMTKKELILIAEQIKLQ